VGQGKRAAACWKPGVPVVGTLTLHRGTRLHKVAGHKITPDERHSDNGIFPRAVELSKLRQTYSL
jgi:hypothetical protein